MTSLAILVPTAFVASAISGAIGMGGGVTLLAVMATVLDPTQVVPIHGVVQLVSNGTRTLRLMRRVSWWVLRLYVPALLIGVVVGLRLYSGAGMPWFRPAIGAFVLSFLAWEQLKPKRLVLPRWLFAPAGVVGGVLTVVVGASGPYLAAFFLRDDLEREEIVGTKAAIQVVGHFAKIAAFASVGFPYVDHLGLILPLVACAVLGTLTGTWMLRRMGERVFHIVFRLGLALLALRLVTDAWWR